MELDAYSICPGGTGMKIKFCCPDRLEDLRKVHKLMEAGQNAACLNTLDALMEKEPDRPCFLELRCMVLETAREKELEFIATAKRFYELYPDNPIALAESAHALLLEEHHRIFSRINDSPEEEQERIFLEEQDSMRQVLGTITRRLEQAFQADHLYSRVVEKTVLLSQIMRANRCYNAAAVWQSLLTTIKGDAPLLNEVAYTLNAFYADVEVPLCMRTGLLLRKAPEGVAWQAEFDAAFELASHVRWTDAEEAFARLAVENPEAAKSSEIWYNLAALAEWHCDLKAAIGYWKKYLASDGLPFYEALESQIHLGSLQPHPLEDTLEGFVLKYPLSRTDGLLEAFLSNPYFQQIDKPQNFGDRSNAILACFELLDAPKPASIEGKSVEDLPLVCGAVILWGRQTDREPELEVFNVLQSHVDFVSERLREAVGDYFAGEQEMRSVGPISITRDAISRRVYVSSRTPMEEIIRLRNEHFRNMVLEHWLHLPLGIFGKKPLAVVAQDPAMRVRVEAAMYFLRQDAAAEELDVRVLDELREKLEMPPLPEVPTDALYRLSPLFYNLLKPEGLSPKDLEYIVMRGARYGVAEIPEDVLLAAAHNEELAVVCRMEAFLTLIRTQPEAPQVPQWLHEGNALCAKYDLSNAMFDVLEMTISANLGHFQAAIQKIKHIRERHSDDTNAMQQVARVEGFLNNVLRYLQTQQSQGGVPGTPDGGAIPPQAPPPSSGIWTPDSPSGQGGSSDGSSKLWIPE